MDALHDMAMAHGALGRDERKLERAVKRGRHGLIDGELAEARERHAYRRAKAGRVPGCTF